GEGDEHRVAEVLGQARSGLDRRLASGKPVTAQDDRAHYGSPDRAGDPARISGSTTSGRRRKKSRYLAQEISISTTPSRRPPTPITTGAPIPATPAVEVLAGSL